MSISALIAGVTRGPAAIRKVIGQTLVAGFGPPEGDRVVGPWDIVRGFPLDNFDVVSVIGGAWHDGATAPLERYLMGHLVRYFRPMELLEIGTFRGATTRLLIENAPAGARVHTIDLPPDRQYSALTAPSDERLVRQWVVGLDYRGHPREKDIKQVLGDTFEPRTWTQIKAKPRFVFIDASHTYAAVKNDTQKAMEIADPDAVFIWHDYSSTECSPERGVGKYIQELMAQRDDVFIIDQTDFAIRVPRRELNESRVRVGRFFGQQDRKRLSGRPPFAWLAPPQPSHA